MEDVSGQDIQGGEGGNFHVEGMKSISKPPEYSVPWFLYMKITCKMRKLNLMTSKISSIFEIL